MKEVFTIDIGFTPRGHTLDEIDNIVDEAIVDTCPYKTGRLQDSITWEVDGDQLIVMQDENLCDYFFYCDDKTGFIDDFEHQVYLDIKNLKPDTDTFNYNVWDFSIMIKNIREAFKV